jgi:hypothetical protein
MIDDWAIHREIDRGRNAAFGMDQWFIAAMFQLNASNEPIAQSSMNRQSSIINHQWIIFATP